MNNEDLETTLAQIIANLEPTFSKLFTMTEKAESAGYLDFALRHKKNKDEHTILRVGRKEIFFVQHGKMKRQYKSIKDMDARHLDLLVA